MNLTEGQEVYLLPIGNNVRYTKEVSKGKVVSIKNKYFYVLREGWHKEIQFKIEDNREKSDFPNWKIFASLQEIEDNKEKERLDLEMYKFFNGYRTNLSLIQLRKIKDIINEVKQ